MDIGMRGAAAGVSIRVASGIGRRGVMDPSLALLMSAFVMVSAASPAQAIEILAKGNIIFLGGPIKPGDSVVFRDFYKAAVKGTYRGVYLASGGGFIVEAITIGRLIRSEGLATIVDAHQSVCASACTAIFASGIKRFYLNAETISDGQPFAKGSGGLGFHDGNTAASLHPNHYSGNASALMIDAYYEFGVPGAAQVISKAPPDKLYRLSAKTALALGIATNVGKQ